MVLVIGICYTVDKISFGEVASRPPELSGKRVKVYRLSILYHMLTIV